jgi:hypothetical protein
MIMVTCPTSWKPTIDAIAPIYSEVLDLIAVEDPSVDYPWLHLSDEKESQRWTVLKQLWRRHHVGVVVQHAFLSTPTPITLPTDYCLPLSALLFTQVQRPEEVRDVSTWRMGAGH